MKKTFILLIVLFFSTLKGQDTLKFNEEYLPSTNNTLIFKPTDYNSDGSYPLVYLLHGYGGSYQDWNNHTNIQKFADQYEFIIVTPEGYHDSWYVDNPHRPKMQFEKFFWNDLVPKVFEEYSIDRSAIFITGLSMGGHGAMTLFLKNPNFFKSAGSMSGILDLTFFPDRWSIKQGLGSIDEFPDEWKNNSAMYLLKNIAGTDKSIIFDCGTEDFAYEVNELFAKKCEDLNVNYKFISQPGNHSWPYWIESIKDHLQYFNDLIFEEKE